MIVFFFFFTLSPKFVADVVIGAPYSVTNEMLTYFKVVDAVVDRRLQSLNPVMKLQLFGQVDYVVHGNTPAMRDVDGKDPYEVNLLTDWFVCWLKNTCAQLQQPLCFVWYKLAPAFDSLVSSHYENMDWFLIVGT